MREQEFDRKEIFVFLLLAPPPHISSTSCANSYILVLLNGHAPIHTGSCIFFNGCIFLYLYHFLSIFSF